MKFVVFTIVVRLLKFSRDSFRLSIRVYIPMHIVRVKLFIKLILVYISAVLKILKLTQKCLS